MACKCFSINKDFSNLSFADILEAGKCSCNARFLVEENKMRFEIVGLPKKQSTFSILDKVKIDGFLSKDQNNKKCDYLFVYKKDRFIFVELKGSDIIGAVKQIEATIELFKQNDILLNKTVKGFIVSAKYNPACGPTLLRKRNEMARKYAQYKFILCQKNNHIKYNPELDSYS